MTTTTRLHRKRERPAPKRKDHKPAILRYLAKGPKTLGQIVAHLRADDAHRAVEYDIRTLRAARVIVSRARKWELR